MFKPQIQQNKDWNSEIVDASSNDFTLVQTSNPTKQGLKLIKPSHYLLLRTCSNLKSNKTRIETSRQRTSPLSLLEFKPQIQQNKDWNSKSEWIQCTGCFMFKPQIQQNKDWNKNFTNNSFNSTFVQTSNPTKQGLKHPPPPPPTTPKPTFKPQIQQNKDWNGFTSIPSPVKIGWFKPQIQQNKDWNL